MGIFTRPDSPWWWLYLPTAPLGKRKVKTAILIGTTSTERHDNKRLAEQVYAQRMTELAARIHKLPSARPSIRFSAYVTTYANDVIAHQKGHYRAQEILKVLLRTFGEDYLDEIDRDRVRHFMTLRLKTCAPRTVNREVDLLKAMIRDAVPKYLENSPLRGMKKIPASTPQRRLMSPDEERRLLKAATDPVDKALILLGRDCLVRMGDILDLKRGDRQGIWITIRDPKSGRLYQIPLTKRAATALNAIPLDSGSEYYFAKFRKAELQRNWRGAVRQRMEYLCAQANPPIPFGRKKNGFTFHWGTRRTGATRYLVKHKQPIPVVQRMGNWKTPDVLLEIYAEADNADLLAAVGRRSVPNPSRSKRKSA